MILGVENTDASLTIYLLDIYYTDLAECLWHMELSIENKMPLLQFTRTLLSDMFHLTCHLPYNSDSEFRTILIFTILVQVNNTNKFNSIQTKNHLTLIVYVKKKTLLINWSLNRSKQKIPTNIVFLERHLVFSNE